MNSYRESECEDLVSFIAGEGTQEERERYKRHLASCSDCRREYEELMQVWSSLPYTTELVEPPNELRGHVMKAVFGLPAGAPVHPAQTKPRFTGAVRPVIGMAAALAAGIWIGFWWRGEQLLPAQKSLPTEPTAINTAEPIHAMTHLMLKAADPTMPAAAEATVTKQGVQFGMMIQAKGLPTTKDQETYQVWLIKDGQRTSAGMFCVDKQGNGVLHFEAGREPPSFDAIGITLEPDANGSQPRGKKVLGTT